MKPTFQGEIQLLGWSESHNGGAKVTFQLADPSDLEPFKAMTVAKGKTAGQRLACVLVEIGEDEQPVESMRIENSQNLYTSPEHVQKSPECMHKGGPLAKLAGQWCSSPRFWRWANETQGTMIASPMQAAHWVRTACHIESRAELDHDKEAADIFHEHIRIPYAEYLRSEPAIREAA